MKTRKRPFSTLFLLFFFLVGCQDEPVVQTPIVQTPIAQTVESIFVVEATAVLEPSSTFVSTVTPEPTRIPTLPPATPTLTPDTGWLLLQTGLEQRIIRTGERTVISILRLDPEMFTFRLGYHPSEPQGLREWQTQEQALITVNGGYFTEEFLATGRIVVDGVGSGISYGAFAGMLTVADNGVVDIRWLEQEPYTGDEGLAYALQSFPLLVKPVGELGFPDETGRSASRTIIGMDANGRFLIVLTTSLTLHEASVWLVESDLALDVALNLDGGPSSGLILQEPFWEIPSYVPLPAVLLIDPHSEGD